MERLTKIIVGYPHGAEGISKDRLTGNYCRGEFEATACVEKLAEYEDKEEQGRLVKLPCKVGDTLYRVDTDPNMPGHDIKPYRIDNIVLCNDGDALFKYDAYDGVICGLKTLITGEPYLGYYRVFLTQGQAEQFLKEMGINQ